jgi:plastocyanin
MPRSRPLTWSEPFSYQCTNHSGMSGQVLVR